MKHILKTITGVAVIFAIIFSGCSNDRKNKKDKESTTLEAERGEHDRDTESGGEGEESGTQFRLDDVYDDVRKGAHLILSYDTESNSFLGTVENTTDEVLEKVRVEVHLSNGIELGPTTAVNLKPGEKVDVELKASEKDFETWSTHVEVGSSEHEHEGGEGEHDEGDEEHGEEGEGEHK